ncbi:hypothetical protein [Pseudomonas syringae group genomosp. 3]|uniref:Uncharacterized protein n=2 Tax=Pseudomonas syringae group genomosp. 3 TaxID=251701 RepID=Q87Y65_PSESM|nr:hypothetical protein [Pseudomonas syringae group genomosp. 3]AAO57405.1 hypothetical protein PSPTO_3944 [Pseudomonas syringae pv. tomato str. DC3000]KPB89476.1 Uncharacterized protein AC502_3860 [Pseudomonas syringae pv. maculicola]
MSADNRITLVLRPREGETLDGLQFYSTLGAPVSVGRALGVISSVYEGDAVNGLLDMEEDHTPSLRRLIDQVPGLYLQVSNEVKREALNDGDDEAEAEYKAGQALRVLMMFKQRLERAMEPDLLTTHAPGSLITENPAIAKTVENINRTAEESSIVARCACADEHLNAASDARRYRWLRDVAWDTPRQDLALRDRHQNMLADSELDAEIDRAMQAYPRAWGQERRP